jgi:hypothetical protein
MRLGEMRRRHRMMPEDAHPSTAAFRIYGFYRTRISGFLEHRKF